MNIYKKLADLVRQFNSAELLAIEIESLEDSKEEVETLEELADFLQTELSYVD